MAFLQGMVSILGLTLKTPSRLGDNHVKLLGATAQFSVSE